LASHTHDATEELAVSVLVATRTPNDEGWHGRSWEKPVFISCPDIKTRVSGENYDFHIKPRVPPSSSYMRQGAYQLSCTPAFLVDNAVSGGGVVFYARQEHLGGVDFFVVGWNG